MTNPVTYSLQNESGSSSKYYRDISVFTDLVLVQVKKYDQIIEAYAEFSNKTKKSRSFNEYALDFLLFGVYCRLHDAKAQSASRALYSVLSVLGKIRQNNTVVKPMADLLRAILIPFLLKEKSVQEKPLIFRIKNLIRWLSAAGDYPEEVKRIESVYGFVSQLSIEKAHDAYVSAVDFASWFEDAAQKSLSRYLPNVDSFVSSVLTDRKFKEDYLFCSRPRVEYYINMTGAEIMNRAYREKFLQRKTKAVFVPGCMRAKSGRECRAEKMSLGYVCRQCTAVCGVRDLTMLGKKKGFDVYIALHGSTLFAKGIREKSLRDSLGVVGVACPLNLLSGGWKVVSTGIPPQCVILNYCGCKAHWDKTGRMTSIDTEQLLHVLGTE